MVGADRPSSSRKWRATYPEVLSAYRSWLRWNISRSGVKPHGYKGDLIKKREEEMTVAMATVRVD